MVKAARMNSRFITFEGGEGSGKTTQIARLKAVLEAAYIPHLITREPGGEPNAERIRELLVTGDKNAWDPLAETLLFYAARVQHVARVINPALAAGKLVVCDRFMDSTLVYQGIGKGMQPEFIQALHSLTLGNLKSDLTFILDIPPVEGLKRAGARSGNENRFEGMATEFHEQVRAGFLAIARNEPSRCVVVDALQSADDIHLKIIKKLCLSSRA